MIMTRKNDLNLRKILFFSSNPYIGGTARFFNELASNFMSITNDNMAFYPMINCENPSKQFNDDIIVDKIPIKERIVIEKKGNGLFQRIIYKGEKIISFLVNIYIKHENKKKFIKGKKYN